MLTAPWALLGLISIPVVFGIYFFRTRSRRREVSALFLWVDRSRPTQGGRRFQNLQMPLLLLLEILALLLLCVAAAKPMYRAEARTRPTVIVLDTSYSMSAGLNGDTSQQRATADLEKMFDTQIGFPVQFVLAGVKPQLLAHRAKNAAEAGEILKNWTCNEPTADLNTAVTFAANVSLPDTRILVVTDHLSSDANPSDSTYYVRKAYGKKLGNLAVVNSSRVFHNSKDRLLLEIANFSETEQPLQFVILEQEKQRIVYRQTDRRMAPGEIFTLRTEIPAGIGTLEIRLNDDVLEFDNRLTLLPPPPPVRVQLGILPDGLNEKIKRAAEVSGIAVTVTERPDIIFGDFANTVPPSCSVRFVSEPDTSAVKPYIGPFILERSHPLTEGISLDGVVWAAKESQTSAEQALISAGVVPLLTEIKRSNRESSTSVLTFYLNEKLSTLTDNPVFPALIWNILKREQKSAETNRSGISVTESNLLSAVTASEGEWLDDETLRTEFQSFAYLLLLATLGILTAHLYAMKR